MVQQKGINTSPSKYVSVMIYWAYQQYAVALVLKALEKCLVMETITNTTTTVI